MPDDYAKRELAKRDDEAQKSKEKNASAKSTGDKNVQKEADHHATKSISHEVAANARESDKRK